ncbi:MAG: isochorismatase family protein [Kiritimatiellae bacterium]|nr:isochorismatase family protein [Kiritimatiellia bacterium]
MPDAILITQCLQNDFVKPLGRFEPLPNQLHVGFEEARRLMGEQPDEGPVAQTMRWACSQPAATLALIHIRDWHDPADAFQTEHFRQFGAHCVAGTDGARFAFPHQEPDDRARVVNSPGLNDFVGTPLAELLRPFEGRAVRVGLIGVWTEAKVSFLAYDLRTRYPEMQLAVCSALTASSSRTHHFMALDQLRRLLGCRVFSSIGEFTRFLAGSTAPIPLPHPTHADGLAVTIEGDAQLGEPDTALIRHLFRDCRRVTLKVLAGGFSGNLVLGSRSEDIHGHEQAPHVVKIGPQGPIGQEREAFEQIEDVLGNSAPRITQFADLHERGALKYRYAAMGGGFSSTFQKLYCAGLPREKTERYLAAVFREQLGRLYSAATCERCNLLAYYDFAPNPARTESLARKIGQMLGTPPEGDTLRLPTGHAFPNPIPFYARELDRLLPMAAGSSFFAFVHGDLNGANIIVDAHENVWLIDFFHTHRGHVLKDLIKLENDLLYIFTPVPGPDALAQAVQITDRLLAGTDLAEPLPEPAAAGVTGPAFRRAYDTVRFMRGFYRGLIGTDRDPLQLLIGQLRYAAHTLFFSECDEMQKLWALYAAGRYSAEITSRLRARGPRGVDWLAHRDA